MFDLLTRQLKEEILQPFVNLFTVLTPNQITLLSGAAGIACCIAIIQSHYYIALLLWLINRILDGLDGTVARITSQQTHFGGYLDIIVDFTVYSAITIAIAYEQTIHSTDVSTAVLRWTVTAALNGVYFVNAASLFMFSAIHTNINNKNTELTTVSMSPSTALIEGTETVVAYTVFLLVPSYMTPLYLCFGGAVVITILQRLYDAHTIFSQPVTHKGASSTSQQSPANVHPASKVASTPRSRSKSKSRKSK